MYKTTERLDETVQWHLDEYVAPVVGCRETGTRRESRLIGSTCCESTLISIMMIGSMGRWGPYAYVPPLPKRGVPIKLQFI